MLALIPFAGAMKLNTLSKITSGFENTETMPLLFVGHGNPMNAIEHNEFTQGWENTGKLLPLPKAILCISAHWETSGTFVTAMEKPRTIHDFGGFPQKLFDVQYNAPGSPELARETAALVKTTQVHMDHDWGLDHGCWSVIKRFYPEADIPVIQMSLDYRQAPQYHYDLAKELAGLRKKGVLIVGSGNIVHNLRQVRWNASTGYDWAVEANEKVKALISANEHAPLVNYGSLGSAMQMAVPSPEHYLPLLYILGLKNEDEKVDFFNDKTELGAISMTSLRITNNG
jgi:4,5-DOPA dioxygenase extradiol